MVYSIAAEKKDKPSWTELEHAIRRNFGGLDEIDAVEIFRKHVTDDDMMQVPSQEMMTVYLWFAFSGVIAAMFVHATNSKDER
jgi:hypothetical protein